MTEGSFSGSGGLTIHWRAWTPDADPLAVVVISHGAGEHSGRYEHVAAALTGAGFVVYAIDHRGHGRSQGARALINRMDDAVADLERLILTARGRHPGAPLHLLGHSMGATIALSHAVAHGDGLDGLLLSGALAELQDAPAPLRVVVPVISALAPRLGLIAVDAELVSRDPAVVRAYIEDPLVHHGKLPARTVAELSRAVRALPDAVGRIGAPTWIGYGTADRLCPPSGSRMLGERIGATDKTIVGYEGLAHEIFNEPEQERVLNDMAGWLRARTGTR